MSETKRFIDNILNMLLDILDKIDNSNIKYSKGKLSNQTVHIYVCGQCDDIQASSFFYNYSDLLYYGIAICGAGNCTNLIVDKLPAYIGRVFGYIELAKTKRMRANKNTKLLLVQLVKSCIHFNNIFYYDYSNFTRDLCYIIEPNTPWDLIL